MRTSVLAGIFACTLIFLSQSSQAEALELATDKNSETNTSLVKIETMNETPRSPLLAMSDVKEEVALPVEEKKPIVHTVTENESLSTIAKQYQTTWERVYSKNTQIVDPNILNAGIQLVIPEVTEELVLRSAPVAIPVIKTAVAKKQTVSKSTTVSSTSTPKGSSAGNGYVAGYCTWYVKSRRPDMPNNLGNASTWVSRAAAQGFATGSVPRAGAVGQRGNHVVYVESVNGDGTITISDMNYQARYAITTRVVSASQFTYIY